MYKYKRLFFFVFLLMIIKVNGQYNIYESINYDEVKYSLDDLGTMWTFDNIPFERWKEKYGFTPTEEWLEHIQKSALQFGWGCSGAFVSEDGLIMTNHHCGRGDFHLIQKEGEDLLKNGFYAESQDEERRVPELYVDQLIKIIDVTDTIYAEMNKGQNETEKVDLKNAKIKELEDRLEKELNLTIRIITFYNGGKYKAYCYKRYNDVRLVMAPDFQIAATGWDWDNFTYPRYELDFAFYRAYDENGKPVKSEHHFSWSEKGADEGELIFIIGRPGSTRRLISISEMEYLRDYAYKYRLLLFNELYQVYYELMNTRPEDESELLHQVLSFGNGRKSFAGRLLGLKDTYIMAKKIDFEKNLKSTVAARSDLQQQYGHVWEALTAAHEELKIVVPEISAFNLSRVAPVYFEIANEIINYARQMKKPENEREEKYLPEKIDSTLNALSNRTYDIELNEKLLRAHVNFVRGILPVNHRLIKELYGDKKGEEAAEYLLDKSSLSSKEKIAELLKKSPDDILSSDDPFIYFIISTELELVDLEMTRKEITNTIEVLNQMLGEIVFAVHGENIPPDATSSLRITEGEIKGYEYNGTIAPGKNTFFGMYDRYYSFGQKTYPWGLHERWLNPPAEFDLSVPVGFASTNDIVGGNSGSSVINAKGEIVGLVHDGNLESLAGDFIFIPENNRSVASDSYGLMEALIHIFKTNRLVDELKNGRIIN